MFELRRISSCGYLKIRARDSGGRLFVATDWSKSLSKTLLYRRDQRNQRKSARAGFGRFASVHARQERAGWS